jgi:hypothetical protein
MEELFKKVTIKSKADLPKEDYVYVSRTKQGHIALRRFDSEVSNEVSFSNVSVQFWLENIDWYFQPLPQPREVTDPKEELLKFLQFANTTKKVYDLSQEELVVSQYLKSKEQMKGGTK